MFSEHLQCLCKPCLCIARRLFLFYKENLSNSVLSLWIRMMPAIELFSTFLRLTLNGVLCVCTRLKFVLNNRFSLET